MNKILQTIKMISLLILLFFSSMTLAQNQFKNTLFYTQSTTSPKANIESIRWISGYWQGKSWGGYIEEIWSQPMGNSMMASFKFVKDNKVKFYELITISEHQNSLILRLKHFNADLTGWENKEKTLDFKLVKVMKNKVYFDGYTFEKVSPEKMNVYVVIDSKGKKSEMQFSFNRAKAHTL
ncbi:DUF6265 family protein [Aliikangiella sp. IMCC44359]|uniref:DUF6265 family protein n=1 Tax=Aliikangiella sp. IMCC44359 TaxID=3459125 RepID=UPI00403AADDC